jgi:hypothetical protein
MSESPLVPEQAGLLEFLDEQLKDYGGKAEFDPGLWVLFVVPADDTRANQLALTALSGAGFGHQSGVTEDDLWMFYYVDSAHRAAAMYWLQDLRAKLAGEVRPVSPEQKALFKDLRESKMPHRIAQLLVEMHARGEISAGAIDDPVMVRSLLDRLHIQEPLYFAAFHLLLTHHLIDLVVLLRKLEVEDIELENDIVKGALSRDPFLQSRQDAATEIRKAMIHFFLINPLDQEKNHTITNPYSAYMGVTREGDELVAQIDGIHGKVPLASFQHALRTTRKNLTSGSKVSNFNTQVPWMTEEIAPAFRFIKQRLEYRRNLSPIDGLYMLGRAASD